MNEGSDSTRPEGEDLPGDSQVDDTDDPKDHREVRALLETGGLTGKGADVELALANVKDTARHRKVRDRALVASGAAAALLLLIFAAAVFRSGDDAGLETAADDRGNGTTALTSATVGGQPTYSGDPGGDMSTGTTMVGPDGSAPTSVTTVGATPGASTTTTSSRGPGQGPPSANPPVLQLSIHADAGSGKAGERAWFTVQVHNSGGDGTYEGNDCGMGHFKVTLAPALASPGQPVVWSGDAGSFAASVSQGGGGLAIGPIVGGQSVGVLSPVRACPAISEQRKLASGESLTEKVAVDLAAPPGAQVAGTYTATAELSAWPASGGFSNGDPIRATDSTSLNVTGNVPALPGAAALQAVASAPSVAGWVGSQTAPFSMQTRYWRGAWEMLILSGQATISTDEILRIRVDTSGTLIDVRAVRIGSAASDDPGATAPVVGERKLFP